MFINFVTGKALFLRRMSSFQRCLLTWRMARYAAFLQRYRTLVNSIVGDIRGLFTPRRYKDETGDDDTGYQE
jgi:hypothetical protein